MAALPVIQMCKIHTSVLNVKTKLTFSTLKVCPNQYVCGCRPYAHASFWAFLSMCVVDSRVNGRGGSIASFTLSMTTRRDTIARNTRQQYIIRMTSPTMLKITSGTPEGRSRACDGRKIAGREIAGGSGETNKRGC